MRDKTFMDDISKTAAGALVFLFRPQKVIPPVYKPIDFQKAGTLLSKSSKNTWFLRLISNDCTEHLAEVRFLYNPNVTFSSTQHPADGTANSANQVFWQREPKGHCHGALIYWNIFTLSSTCSEKRVLTVTAKYTRVPSIQFYQMAIISGVQCHVVSDVPQMPSFLTFIKNTRANLSKRYHLTIVASLEKSANLNLR